MTYSDSARQGGWFDRLHDHILKKKFSRAKMAAKGDKMADNMATIYPADIMDAKFGLRDPENP